MALLIALAGVAGAVRAEDTVTLRLHFQGATPDAPFVAIEDAKRSGSRMIPLPLDAAEAGRNWWLQGLDAQGRTLYRLPVRNPQLRRIEAFDPSTGEVSEVRDVQVRQGSFDVSFPYDPRLARVTLVAGGASEKARSTPAMPLLDVGRQALERELGRRGNARAKAAAAIAASAATTLLDSGSPADRLDLVFVGDGYTAAELGKWQTDAATVTKGLMSDPLFRRYRWRINIHRVDVASAQSGVDEPDNGLYRDTAMDTSFDCGGVARSMCMNTTKVLSIVGGSLEPAARDVIIVVANSTRYGGIGGSIAAISMHGDAIELALHELGHTLLGLADEYEYGNCSLKAEPAEGNASRVATRNVKWGVLIDPQTTVPTETGRYPVGTVGTFQGAQYCRSGKYRPTENSKMRALGQPWYAVNEALAAQVFERYSRNLVKPRIQMVFSPNAGAAAARATSPPARAAPARGRAGAAGRSTPRR